MISYSPNNKIVLSLGDKVISKESYNDKIENIYYYGTRIKNSHVSVIIAVFNEGDDLLRNLDHLRSQSDIDFEIILVDNGLDEVTRNKLKSYSLIHIVLRENLGPSAGRNIGALYSQGSILTFVDADGYVEDKFIEKIISRMRDESIVALRGKVLPIEKNVNIAMIPHGYDLGDTSMLSFIDTEGCSAFRKEDYIRVGGMEDDLFGHEGVTIGFRMCEFYGYEQHAFIYDPDIILYHDHHNTEGKLEKKSRRYAILDRQINLRYPFYKEYVKFYSSLRKNNVRDETQQEKELRKITENVRETTVNEYGGIDEKRKELRYSNSDLLEENQKYKFSIVIPCYNLGLLLPKAIDSVFAQTLEDIEVIVVDDASPDEETQKVLDEVEDYVHVVRLKENGGVSVARNKGIEMAKSEYILCLDADDTIKPTYLEKAKNIFDGDKDVGLVSCYARFFGDRDNLWVVNDKLTVQDALISSPLHTATCFRKALHDSGGGYDVALRGYEDWDHWIRIMKQGCVVRVIPDTLFNYYVRPKSKVKTSNKKSQQLVKRIVQNHRSLFEENMETIIAQKHFISVQCLTRYRVLQKQYEQCRRPNLSYLYNKVKRHLLHYKKERFPAKWL